MHIADFALERYFAKWEFAVRHVLCASDAEPLEMRELLSLADPDDEKAMGYAAARLYGVARNAGAARRDRPAIPGPRSGRCDHLRRG